MAKRCRSWHGLLALGIWAEPWEHVANCSLAVLHVRRLSTKEDLDQRLLPVSKQVRCGIAVTESNLHNLRARLRGIPAPLRPFCGLKHGDRASDPRL
ncbi:hypothetical protein F5Y08DRAFT_308664 [Xylaria arbuscula]|nr:hypothetical protein F5Y08DRAFT_308664 [Xylaria arbuscula]